jgi:2-polyprenyl-3-methyl-5-hydroxy-6-metoxy-1,4-benzoquinol methylase
MDFKEHPIVWDDVKVSRLWNYYSKTPPYSEVYFSKVFGDAILKRSRLPIDTSLSILDFGCGPGFIWEHILKLNAQWSYTGIDFSPDSVAEISQKGAGHKQFVEAQHITTLPTRFENSQFDAVLLLEVVEHLNDEYLSGTLNEIARVIKPGGILVVSTPNEEDLSASTRFCPECGAIFHEWQHIRNWSVNTLAEKLASHGFALDFAETHDFRVRNIFHKLMRLARRLKNGKTSNPHMIAVFQKKF